MSEQRKIERPSTDERLEGLLSRVPDVVRSAVSAEVAPLREQIQTLSGQVSSLDARMTATETASTARAQAEEEERLRREGAAVALGLSADATAAEVEAARRTPAGGASGALVSPAMLAALNPREKVSLIIGIVILVLIMRFFGIDPSMLGWAP